MEQGRGKGKGREDYYTATQNWNQPNSHDNRTQGDADAKWDRKKDALMESAMKKLKARGDPHSPEDCERSYVKFLVARGLPVPRVLQHHERESREQRAQPRQTMSDLSGQIAPQWQTQPGPAGEGQAGSTAREPSVQQGRQGENYEGFQYLTPEQQVEMKRMNNRDR